MVNLKYYKQYNYKDKEVYLLVKNFFNRIYKPFFEKYKKDFIKYTDKDRNQG